MLGRLKLVLPLLDAAPEGASQSERAKTSRPSFMHRVCNRISISRPSVTIGNANCSDSGLNSGTVIGLKYVGQFLLIGIPCLKIL